MPLVHRLLDLFSDLHRLPLKGRVEESHHRDKAAGRLLEIRRLRVHENRIGVTINLTADSTFAGTQNRT